MTTVQKRKCLTMIDKLGVIECLQAGQSKVRVSRHYNLPHSIVSNIFKNRVLITRTFDRQCLISRKIENALLAWLESNRETHVSITVPFLRAKANELAKSFDIPNFKCTTSWILLFKHRHRNKFVSSATVNALVVPQNATANDWLITKLSSSWRKLYTADKNIYNASETEMFYKMMSVKSFSFQGNESTDNFGWTLVNDNNMKLVPVISQNAAANDWLKTEWPLLRKGYTDKEIYNASETGVFYKLMPDKSFRFQGNECKDGELPEERLTILITVNMTGTDKKKLLVIGKHNGPRSFKGITDLPVQYEHNQKSWMTSSIFRTFMHRWDKELFQTSKKALVLIDDCPVHLGLSNLLSIKVVYLPFKSLIPMNQGIIKSFKFHFKKNLILHHVKQIENIQITKVDMFQAICMLELAWNQVSFGVITNCFKCFDSLSIKQVKESNKKENLVSWAEKLLVFDVETLQKFENVDSELVTSNQLLSQLTNQYNNVEGTDDDEEIDMIKDKITLHQACDVLEKLKQFLATNEYFLKSYNHTKQLQIILDNSLYKLKNSQTKITSL
ncbi:tigger transposable element-derived protein 4-like [Aphis gossypii]|uniref:HTH CENPB-type domain-containing protein n=1 Tax=Aphis gossypii TaxID=80765 RepID=A0A9P0IR02_APHGO|nr:tigger transposable element-derived protein 4-like [Aphis gossypii]CAH1712158.1 unnamed protein product [Aphis gossypii]